MAANKLFLRNSQIDLEFTWRQLSLIFKFFSHMRLKTNKHKPLRQMFYKVQLLLENLCPRQPSLDLQEQISVASPLKCKKQHLHQQTYIDNQRKTSNSSKIQLSEWPILHLWPTLVLIMETQFPSQDMVLGYTIHSLIYWRLHLLKLNLWCYKWQKITERPHFLQLSILQKVIKRSKQWLWVV